MKSNNADIFWTATCQDVFGGYGLFATGRTKLKAQQVMWSVYSTNAPKWNWNGKLGCSSLEELEDEWGVSYRKCLLAEGYFGDDDEGDHITSSDNLPDALATAIELVDDRYRLISQRENNERDPAEEQMLLDTGAILNKVLKKNVDKN